MVEGPRHVLVRVDADHAIGLGHAVRSGCLVAALGGHPRVTVLGRGEALSTCFPEAGGLDPGAGAVAALQEAGPADLLLVDQPQPEPELLEAARRRGVETVLVDDFGGNFQADLVINGTAPPSQHQYELPTGARLLAGPEYALVRPCFRALRRRAPPRAARVTALLGSGPGAEALLLAMLDAGLSKRRGPRLEIVVGSAFPLDDALRERCAAAGAGLAQGLSGLALARILARSTLVVTTGGMSVYECLAAQVPVLVQPHVASADAEVRWLAASGVLEALAPGGPEPEDLARHVAVALERASAREARALRGAALVDGFGVMRAASAVGARLRTERRTETFTTPGAHP